MKKSISLLMAISFLLSITSSNAQIKNATTETVKISGNGGMCKSKIEKAGNLKKVAQVDWDQDSKMATLTYDAEKTNRQEILKRIALAGYDSEEFLAPDDVYDQLHGCCQYERTNKSGAKTKMMATDMSHQKTAHTAPAVPINKQEANQLSAVFDAYFAVKDALVKTDVETSSAKAQNLLMAIHAVKMETLKMEDHIVWMKVEKVLAEGAKSIADAKNVAQQRNTFISLSQNMYDLIKTAKTEAPVYYQFCPMANDGKGANWLSREAIIENPFYGSQMLNCGKIVETIK